MNWHVCVCVAVAWRPRQVSLWDNKAYLTLPSEAYVCGTQGFYVVQQHTHNKETHTHTCRFIRICVCTSCVCQ